MAAIDSSGPGPGEEAVTTEAFLAYLQDTVLNLIGGTASDLADCLRTEQSGLLLKRCVCVLRAWRSVVLVRWVCLCDLVCLSDSFCLCVLVRWNVLIRTGSSKTHQCHPS